MHLLWLLQHQVNVGIIMTALAQHVAPLHVNCSAAHCTWVWQKVVLVYKTADAIASPC
jgi:hypothetical protein